MELADSENGMFSFTKRADYALLALSYLATAQGSESRLVNTKEIAEQYRIPPELLAKIMQVLARSGLVSSFPGPTGGYRLSRHAREIGIVHCSNGNDLACDQFDRCTIRTPLHQLEERMNGMLSQISIQEISQEPALDA
jgi:Rrf2 family protein